MSLGGTPPALDGLVALDRSWSTRRPTERALPSILLSVVLPGVDALNRRRWVRGTVLLALACVLPVIGVVWALTRTAGELAQVALRPTVLVALGIVALMVAVARFWAVTESWWAHRPYRKGVPLMVLAMVLAFASAAPAAVAAQYGFLQAQVLNDVFAGGSSNGPIASIPGGKEAGGGGELTEFSRYNVLLLGGDAGKNRIGLRTDSMVLISIDPKTGDTALVSVPRNLERIPFPAGSKLAAKFPNGFDDLANAVYTYVVAHPDLAPQAPSGADPGAVAITQAVSTALGVRIDHYVLVDMAGFVDIVDALGGITLTIPERVPSPGNPPGSKHPVPRFIGPGTLKLDGTLALAYARSRSGDNDYFRMGRQRCVLAGIADSATPTKLATRFRSLANTVRRSARSTIPVGDLPALARLVDKVEIGHARTLSLTPPVVDPTRPRYTAIRTAVQQLLNPTSAPPSTSDSTAGSTTTVKTGHSTTSTPPMFEAGATLEEQCRVG